MKQVQNKSTKGLVSPNWESQFDEKFYRNKERVWMSRGGESYGSIVPEMGRGELFRFIRTLIDQAREETREECAEVAERKANFYQRNEPEKQKAALEIATSIRNNKTYENNI